MGVGKRQQAIRAMRGQMWSPGRPSVARREDRQRFWRAIAAGCSSEDAATAAGVSQAVGSRRFQALYVQSRGALRRELAACLRTGRALRVPRARSRQKAWAHVTPEVTISERPAEAADRAVPGHWEGDLLIGLERSAIGTLVERTTRFTMLIHLPREGGYGTIARTKNGPALAGYGAVTMKNALASRMTTLPGQLRRSLTWDRGKELSQHAAFKVETGIPVYFADPQSPWQRGTNENTNGLLRQYFPRGTDLARWGADELEAVAAALNRRPRKTLDWRTPAEALNEYLQSSRQTSVATTG